MSRVYTGGTFDLFHAGHVDLLKQCRQIAGEGTVTVALNTDKFVTDYKGRPPVCSYAERRAVLDACTYVDDVVIHNNGLDSKPTILAVRPDFVVIGADWARRDYFAQMGFDADWLRSHDIGLLYVEHRQQVSTTIIKGRVP